MESSYKYRLTVEVILNFRSLSGKYPGRAEGDWGRLAVTISDWTAVCLILFLTSILQPVYSETVDWCRTPVKSSAV